MQQYRSPYLWLWPDALQLFPATLHIIFRILYRLRKLYRHRQCTKVGHSSRRVSQSFLSTPADRLYRPQIKADLLFIGNVWFTSFSIWGLFLYSQCDLPVFCIISSSNSQDRFMFPSHYIIDLVLLFSKWHLKYKFTYHDAINPLHRTFAFNHRDRPQIKSNIFRYILIIPGDWTDQMDRQFQTIILLRSGKNAKSLRIWPIPKWQVHPNAPV